MEFDGFIEAERSSNSSWTFYLNGASMFRGSISLRISCQGQMASFCFFNQCLVVAHFHWLGWKPTLDCVKCHNVCPFLRTKVHIVMNV